MQSDAGSGIVDKLDTGGFQCVLNGLDRCFVPDKQSLPAFDPLDGGKGNVRQVSKNSLLPPEQRPCGTHLLAGQQGHLLTTSTEAMNAEGNTHSP